MIRWKGARAYRASTIVLVISNLIPLVGVFAWGWSAFNVVALYWVENLIIGAVNILKMLTCNPQEGELGLVDKARAKLEVKRSQAISSGGGENDEAMARQLEQIEKLSGKVGIVNHGMKVFMIPFFTVHYGMFCLVHGVFVMSLLGDRQAFSGGGSPFGGGLGLFGKVIDDGGLWFVLVLAGSHLFSYFVNYIGKGEYRRTVVPKLMFAPYPRIVVLHIAILLGAFAITALGSSLFLVLLLVIGKIIVDLGLHLRSHEKLMP